MSDLLFIKGIQSKTFPDELGYDLECGRTRSQLFSHATW